MRAPGERQRGVAVLTAMLVVTLGTMIAVNMMWNASLEQRRASAGLAADQGIAYLQGAEAWAGDISARTRSNFRKAIISASSGPWNCHPCPWTGASSAADWRTFRAGST